MDTSSLVTDAKKGAVGTDDEIKIRYENETFTHDFI
jgi:hypothetical protein